MTRLDTAGSTLFKLTWKGRTTPLGRRYLQRRALALRTSANGCTSWPTPKLPKYSHDLAKFKREPGRTTPTDLETAALLSGWNTPIANDAEKRGVPVVGAGLAGSVHLTTWPTPTVEDSQCAGSRKHSMTVNSAAGQTATLTDSGQMRIGYSARDGIVKVGNGAQLNPEHSRWLQGLPTAFSSSVDTAMRSFRKSQKRS